MVYIFHVYYVSVVCKRQPKYYIASYFTSLRFFLSLLFFILSSIILLLFCRLVESTVKLEREREKKRVGMILLKSLLFSGAHVCQKKALAANKRPNEVKKSKQVYELNGVDFLAPYVRFFFLSSHYR